MRRCVLAIVLLLTFAGCDDIRYGSSIPLRRVQLAVDTRAGEYVHFVPSNTGATMIVDAKGYHFNKQTMPLTNSDFFGFAGIVVIVDFNQTYSAFDLGCPHCLQEFSPCEVEGIYATCPICGEMYDLSFGYGLPTKGISKEALKKYTTFYSNYRLTIRN